MSSSSNVQVEQRLQHVEQSLANTSRKLSRGAIVTRVVGLLLLALICGYFVYGHREISDLVDPDNLVPLAGSLIDDNVPRLRESLQSTVAESAPLWAQDLSESAINALPTAREQLEEYILEQTDQALDQALAMGETRFRAMIQENRAELDSAFADLARDDVDSAATVKVIVDTLAQEMGRDMEDEAHQVLGTLIGLKEKLQRLAKGGNLTEEELAERNALMTIRHIQLREALGPGEAISSGARPTLFRAEGAGGDDDAPAEAGEEAPADVKVESVKS